MPTFTFFAVDKGNMTLVQFSNGINLVVDCRDCLLRPSPLDYLKSKIQKLDIVAITHPHQDHISGLQQVCEHFKPKHFWHCGRYFQPDPIFEDWTFYEKCRKGELPYCRPMAVRAGQIVRIGDAEITVLGPNLPFLEGTPDDTNNNGMILSIVGDRSKLIVTGDTQTEQWDTLDGSLLEGTSILLASHHGRESGFSERALRIMRPQRIIISDGVECDTDATSRYARFAPVSTTRNNNVVVAAVREAAPLFQ
jgi:competence protein ComEC